MLNLLPYPRSLKRERGFYLLPKQADLRIVGELPWETALAPAVERLRSAIEDVGVKLDLARESQVGVRQISSLVPACRINAAAKTFVSHPLPVAHGEPAVPDASRKFRLWLHQKRQFEVCHRSDCN